MKGIYFCPKCGIPLEINHEDFMLVGTCKCGFKREVKSFEFTEKEEKKKKIGKGLFKKYETAGFPHKCEKCGYGYCEIIEYGPFYSDESPIYLYKCKKCGYTERQADGSSNN